MATTQTRLDLADLVALRWDRATELLAESPRAFVRAGDGVLYVWTDDVDAPAWHWTASATSCNCPDARSMRAAGCCKHQALSWMVATADATAVRAAVVQTERARKLAPLAALFD